MQRRQAVIQFVLVIAAAFTVVGARTSSDSRTRRLFHTHLTKSEPAANDTLAASPRALRLWFSEKVELAVTNVKLVDAGGSAIVIAPLARPDTGEQAPVVAELSKPLPPGTYVVNWSTAAKDGHPAKGSYPFVVRFLH